MCVSTVPLGDRNRESYLVLVGTHAEMLDGLTRVLGSAEEEGVGTGGLLESELIESQGLAASGEDARAGSGGEAEGSNGELGNLEETVVIGDGGDDDDGLLLAAVLDVVDDARDRHGRTVDAAHKQPAEDNLVEGRVGTACVRPNKLVSSSSIATAHDEDRS